MGPVGTISTLVFRIASGTMGGDRQLGFELSVMRLSQLVLPITSGTLGWDGQLGFELLVDGCPNLSFQSHVVQWDGTDGWDLSYQCWDQLGFVLSLPSGTLGWDR